MAYRIGVIPGDGIGPEVTREALKVLSSVAQICNIKYEITEYPFGGEYYLSHNKVLPDGILDEFKKLSAILLGAIGHPDVPPGVLEKGVLLKIRFGLDQYINLRPVKLYPGIYTPIKNKTPKDIDFVVVRENTECLYSGIGGRLRDEVVIETMIYTRKGIERCIRYAYDLARKRRKRLTLVDKSNVLVYGHGLWQEIFKEVGKEYSDITQDHAHVDAMCMWMIKNPEWFDTVVTCNMFGDIITDLGAIIQGGMGVAPGGNINPEGVSMFEPIHGSAPKHANKGFANPIASILAMAMMLDNLGETKAAEMVENAVSSVCQSGRIKDMSAGKMGVSTSEVGDLVIGYLK
ncbi:TPA: 3-isopropylmalate dehydrogenase [bacterium]|nr:3-isopropylmalate dehydrogenase [bacterium]